MKHLTQPRTAILREAQPYSEFSPSPNPSSMIKQKSSPNPSGSRKQKCSKENAPPMDLNAMLESPIVTGKPSPAAAGKMRSPLPPRPPPSNPLKRKLNMETVPETGPAGSSDSGVQVVVRMRPPTKDEEEGDLIVQKIGVDSLTILGQTFTFDSVADPESTQLDIFQLVGAPLVENCLAGFNSSVFAYGQTGSGKTYTMWGPANALLEDNLSSDQQGLTPRVFEQLFARIKEEQSKHADKQLIYQCRCSFLEIYNEQITDLLDPSQRNLQGLSNRRTGSTSINAESSRSHSVFTCVVESRCKSAADGLSSFKTSRINLVDLAGSERQKLTGAAGDRLKEAGNINRSLSQLGNLINILAEVSQTGKQRHIPYRDSRLTFLLQESLGGNAKLAMVCAISPAQSCKSETLSTLRFAQRAKAIKNKAVVNEVMQDDVNFLREVIRQLKEEMQRMKENGNQTDPNGAYSTGWNARRSLNLLKFSLNRPMMLPCVDEDGDEEMEIVEESDQTDVQSVAGREASGEATVGEPQTNRSESAPFENKGFRDTDVIMEEETCEQCDNDQCLKSSVDILLNEESPSDQVRETPTHQFSESSGEASVHIPPADLSLIPSEISPILKSPTPSVSPRVNNNSRKSLRTSSILAHIEKGLRDDDELGSDTIRLSFAKASKNSCLNSQSTQTSRSCFAPTEHLAASLHRGLEILTSNRQSSALRRSSFRFSYRSDSMPTLPIEKVDVGIQTCPQNESQEKESLAFLCSKCKSGNTQQEIEDANDASNLQLVPVDGSQSVDKSKKLVPKAVEKVLAGAIRREMALEEYSAKQNTEIVHLNRLVQQYKHERECNSIIGQTREDKIARLESLMDGILTTEEFTEDELVSLKHEHELLKQKYDNHPEVLRTKIELKRVQDELEKYRNFFDMGERDVLLEEIQDLRTQLQYYVDSSPNLARKRSNLLQLTYSGDHSAAPTPLCTIPESTTESLEQKLEQERIRWTEAESKWISLAEELKIELEESRYLAEKQKHELDSEKKCSEELKEAMRMAMEGHARMLEQYADLEERHMHMLARNRKFQEGIEDVKKAASKAGVRGAESKFINALAAEISAIKVEREKERRYFRDENKGLQAQLRDTAEAVQAAGELLVRLKEAEEAVAIAENRAVEAEQETVKAYKQIDKLKKKYENEITSLNQLHSESRFPKEAIRPAYDDAVKYDAGESPDQQWRKEFEPFHNTEDGELSKLAEPSSWFSGYDRCNI
ncbi:kinesin-like protein KIN-12B isoform X2 [Rhododendron vialii]|uniref:kinesin-like protein KIN-12B isoform X2 n=1 Tax=Rhododendron vialii TaxID=182163 RepID=UPI00265F8041|nr:kinesin-like protein KIN-12B isoform X2 [Rhododendron vialii]